MEIIIESWEVFVMFMVSGIVLLISLVALIKALDTHMQNTKHDKLILSDLQVELATIKSILESNINELKEENLKVISVVTKIMDDQQKRILELTAKAIKRRHKK